jgi:hypothetical protein
MNLPPEYEESPFIKEPMSEEAPRGIKGELGINCEDILEGIVIEPEAD